MNKRYWVLTSLWLLQSSQLTDAFSFHPSSFRPITALPATSDRCDVAVFGGGFGGLYTALNIARQNPKLDIALIEPNPNFCFLPLLYDLASGTATELEVGPLYRDILPKSIRHISTSLERMNSTSATLANEYTLSFSAAVIAVGASPQSILERVPGALDLAQPFYTIQDAKQVRRLLNRWHGKAKKIAVVGGGYGGVELAASVQRRLPKAQVTLISRGPPMANTRVESVITQALEKIGVTVVNGAVSSLTGTPDQVSIELDDASPLADESVWDAVLWTAGSYPAEPIPSGIEGAQASPNGRLAVDKALQCIPEDMSTGSDLPLWALGDCAQVVTETGEAIRPDLPKTAQVAVQQANTVSANLLSCLKTEYGKEPKREEFVFREAGSMLTLGGPNGAILAPNDGPLAPIFEPVLDSVGGILDLADKTVTSAVQNSKLAEKLGVDPTTLGLSLGSHGLGMSSSSETASGTLAGTLTGIARRGIYAAAMPTDSQRVVAFMSATLATAASLAREASERQENKN